MPRLREGHRSERTRLRRQTLSLPVAHAFFLANENIPGPIVRTLRELGHDVLWAKEEHPGEADRVLLARAQSEQRVTVTCDADFGELAFRLGLPASYGVVLHRIDWADPATDNAFVVSALTSRDDWTGVFAVVERDRIRIRPLPDWRR